MFNINYFSSQKFHCETFSHTVLVHSIKFSNNKNKRLENFVFDKHEKKSKMAIMRLNPSTSFRLIPAWKKKKG